jgi:defect in organelle trafficking protein DotD
MDVRMNIKHIMLSLVCCIVVTGCSSSNTMTADSPKDTGVSDHDAYVALAEAASSVSQSLTALHETEQAANPPKSISEPPMPASYGMAMPASIDWNGPIEPIVKQIAAATNYQFRTLGRKPSIPILVNVSAKDEAIGDILRDIGYQASNKASVIVFPSTHTIELRYAVH